MCMISLLSQILGSSNKDMYLKMCDRHSFVSHDSMKRLSVKPIAFLEYQNLITISENASTTRNLLKST